MDLRSTRKLYRSDGIFSNVTDLADNLVSVTLEHAYLVEKPKVDSDGKLNGHEGFWVPKIPNGLYPCVRGIHHLPWHQKELDPVLAALGAKLIDGGTVIEFETFEITCVDGHQGLLFHWGCFDQDSEGCVCTGEAMAPFGSVDMVTNSRKAFARFMALQKGVDRFMLTVVG